jgi:glycerol-3-phosphate dehydrogenase
MITVAGGKLTTYRRMAAEIVDKAAQLLSLGGGGARDLRSARTDKEPLPGGVGWPEDDDLERVATMSVEAGARAGTSGCAMRPRSSRRSTGR